MLCRPTPGLTNKVLLQVLRYGILRSWYQKEDDPLLGLLLL
jgi:hypothetical protein